MTDIFIDNFAGGGGASEGIERALGRPIDHAINHDWAALGMHRINHPKTTHHCEDVFAIIVAMLMRGRRIGGAWFSPDCKHFSKAKGGRPLDKKIRGLAFVIFRYAAERARVIYMENVEEIQTWGPLLTNGKPDPKHKGRTWKAFLAVLRNGIPADHPDIPEMLEVLGDSITVEQLTRGFGYQVETKEIRACDHGAPTIRKRLYLVARNDGLPIVWPEQTHFSPNSAFRTPHSPLYKTIAECIDWSIPVRSIFLTRRQARKLGCRRPLSRSTLKRIAMGTKRYIIESKKPYIIDLSAYFMQQKGHLKSNSQMTKGADEPLRTQATRAEHALVSASFVTEHANATHQRNMPINEPGRTQCAEVKGGHFGLVAAHMTQFKTGAIGKPLDEPGPTITAGSHSPETHGGAASSLGLVAVHTVGVGGPTGNQKPRPVDQPFGSIVGQNHTHVVAANLVKLRGAVETHPHAPAITSPGDTISAGGQHHALAACFMAQHNGGFNTNPGHPASEPSSTLSGKGSQQQVVAAHLAAYYGNDQDGQGVDEAARTVTTKERFGLAVSDLALNPQPSTTNSSLTAEQLAGARRVAKFLRSHGVEFEGEFATVSGYVIMDIGMRMLTPRELFRAQGFGDHYIIDRAWVADPATGETREVRLTKEQQIRMCGNSVCPPVAEALVRANNPEMCREQYRMAA